MTFKKPDAATVMSILSKSGLDAYGTPEEFTTAIELAWAAGAERGREEIISMLEASCPPEVYIWDVVDKIRNRGDKNEPSTEN